MRVDPRLLLSRPGDVGDLRALALRDELLKAAEGATAITVLSAYFDADTLREICSAVPKSGRRTCRVSIVVGADQRLLLPSVLEQMRQLKLWLENSHFPDPVIAIYARGAPFHTKLFYFLRGTQPVWFIGSANASNAIAGDRHELMLRLRGRHGALRAYVDAVLTGAIDVAGAQPADVKCIRSFMLDGSLCFQPAPIQPLSFEAVRLSSVQRRALNDLIGRGNEVAHATVRAEGFRFSLVRALTGAEIEDDEDPTDNDDTFASSSAAFPHRKARVRYRHFAIETAFGFWIPDAYVDLIKAQLSLSESTRLQRLADLAAKLEKTAEHELSKRLEEHVHSMRHLLKRGNAGALATRNKLDACFSRFVANSRRRLGNADWRQRHVRRLVLTAMPDLWNDEAAVRDLLSSFFEDVAARASGPGNRPYIIDRLIAEIGYDADEHELTEDEIRELLELRLLRGWARSDWGTPPQAADVRKG